MRRIAYTAPGGAMPRAALWLHSEPSKNQRVAAFAEDVLRAGGFEILPPVTLDASPGSCEAILSGKSQIVVLCWPDEKSFVAIPDICKAIHETDRECVVVMAAKPSGNADELLQAGLDRFIHLGSDAFADLLALQHKTGVL